MRLQSVIRAIYPAQCVACDAQTEADFGLCGGMLAGNPFIGGLVCDTCGAPLPGEDHGEMVQCDDCMTIARPWDRGRAALVYQRHRAAMVLQLKHGDRTDLARPAADVDGAEDRRTVAADDTVLVPVPLHWLRLVAAALQSVGAVGAWAGQGDGLRPSAPMLCCGPNAHARWKATAATRALPPLQGRSCRTPNAETAIAGQARAAGG